MKKVFFAVVVVACLAGAAPYVSGHKAERSLDQWVEYLNSVGGYDASWDYYKKGWLKTDAVLLIKFKQPLDFPLGGGVSQDWVLPLHIEMNHGPLLVKDNFRQGWFSGKVFLSKEHEGWIKEHVQVQGEGPFYTSNIYMDLTGGVHIDDHSLPFTVADNGDTLSVDGYIGVGKMTLDQDMEYSGVIPSISLSGSAGSMTVEDLHLKMALNFAKKYGQYVMPGKAHFSIQSISADFGEDVNFTLKDAVMDSELVFNSNQNDANMMLSFGFKSLLSEDESINDATFEMSFERLSLSFLDKYMALVQQFGSIGAENTSLMAMQMSQLAATELIPSAPKLSISTMKFNTKEGQLNFSGDIEISAEAASKMANPMAMISDVTVNAFAELDKPLAEKLTLRSTLQDINNQLLQSGEKMSEDGKNQMAQQQATMQLNMLVIQGMLVDEDSKYRSVFQFKDGAAKLNGQDIPLPF